MDLSAVCAGCAGAMVLALVGGCQKPSAAPDYRVTIRGQAWHVELARNFDQRYRGLADRPKLDSDKGMLFIFTQPQVLQFCMRQCLIPLDVAFLDGDRKVVKIHTMPVEPYGFDRLAYSSDWPAQYAVEVPAGALGRAGVKVGDKAELSADILVAAKAATDR